MIPVSRSPRSLFLHAVESVPKEQWPQFLDESCAGNTGLRQQVLRLLNAHEQADQFMASPAGGAADALAMTVMGSVGVGRQIGPYKLLEQIGEGGMGVVYVAEQTEPIRRRVALKIIKPGMDSRQVIARFEAERQALAMMDHPNIATVLDGGVSEAGLPYFVMELVRGLPITEYCDQARLTPDQRIELFQTVCQAVQHAHQKGIIHRDLKPSNVLVTVHDGKPVPKVIDFGVAKAIGPQLTEQTVYTAFSQMIGTPLYMSPEQAGLGGLDIDTRSDVYSLGVLLYELLTGQTPFDSSTLLKQGLDELRRILREQEPPRPSQRLSTLKADDRTTLLANRGLDERRLRHLLRGEIDWIVMKGLEKDRSRRYESASALAADLQRYLKHEPVIACPPSIAYSLRKYTRRHWSLLVTGGVVALALIVGTAVSTWSALEAISARKLADERLTLADQRLVLANERLAGESLAKADAEVQRALAKDRQKQSDANYQRALAAVNRMLTLVGGKELYAVPRMLPIQRQLLTDAATFYEDLILEGGDDPDVRFQAAETYTSLALVNAFLRDYSKIPSYYRRSVELLEEITRTHPQNTDYTSSLVYAYWNIGRTSSATAEKESFLRRAIEIGEVLSREHPEHGYKLSLVCIALAEQVQHADPPEAERLYRRAVVSAVGSTRVQYIAQAQSTLGRFLAEAGRLEEAERELREALSGAEAWLRDGTDDSWIRNKNYLLAETHERLGLLLNRRGQPEAAAEELRRSLEYTRNLRNEFPEVANYREREDSIRKSLVTCLKTGGQTPAAVHQLRELLSQLPPRTAEECVELGRLHEALGDLNATLIAYEQALQLDSRNRPAQDALFKLLMGWNSSGGGAGVDKLRALELASKWAETSPDSAVCWARLGAAENENGHYDRAIIACEKALAIDPQHSEARNHLVRSYIFKGNPEQALKMLETDVVQRPGDYRVWANRGEAYGNVAKYSLAISDYTRALELVPDKWWIRRRRATAFFLSGMFNEALADLAAAVKSRPDDDTNLTWLGVDAIAACPDGNFRKGMLALADETVEKSKGTIGAYRARGLLHSALGEFGLAQRDFEASVVAGDAGGPCWMARTLLPCTSLFAQWQSGQLSRCQSRHPGSIQKQYGSERAVLDGLDMHHGTRRIG